MSVHAPHKANEYSPNLILAIKCERMKEIAGTGTIIKSNKHNMNMPPTAAG
jgi:hypothetical protein